MRKRCMGWAAGGVVLAALAMTGALADRAAAQSTSSSTGTAWLGVTTQEITDDLREGLNYKGAGVLVNRVVTGSPADKAGIKKGDVIVSVSARTIDSPSELTDVVRAGKVGASVSVSLVRAGARRNVSAKLAAMPEDLEESWDVPTPPAAPRTPKAPKAPYSYRYDWDGHDFELHDGDWTMLRTMGRGRLGVHIQDLNRDMADALGVTSGKGVLVTDVVEDSPASKVGIKAGDVITNVAGTAVDDVNDLQRALRDREGPVKITLVRRGASRTVEPELEERRIRYRDDPMVLRVPDVRVRRELSESDRRELEAEMRALREELRELRQKMEARDRN